jgi:hypothetical protein
LPEAIIRKFLAGSAGGSCVKKILPVGFFVAFARRIDILDDVRDYLILLGVDKNGIKLKPATALR